MAGPPRWRALTTVTSPPLVLPSATWNTTASRSYTTDASPLLPPEAAVAAGCRSGMPVEGAGAEGAEAEEAGAEGARAGARAGAGAGAGAGAKGSVVGSAGAGAGAGSSVGAT